MRSPVASPQSYPLAVLSEPLRDGHGRVIGDLRVSVTDRCNFRCQYCMPAEGLPWLERAEILTFEEITRIVALFAGMGVGDVRLTGGEPLVRREFPVLAGMLAAVDGVNDLSVTTNGFLLERDAEKLVRAGINRFNVSVDSLQRDRFYELTRRDALDAGAARPRGAGRLPRGPPDQGQRGGDPRLHRGRGHPLRRAGAAHSVPGPLHRVHAAGRRPRLEPQQGADRRRDPGGDRRRVPARARAARPAPPLEVYRFADGEPGQVGFINPVSEPFCADCNRVRLTADGRLRTCLFSLNETDLRAPLREGASDDELEQIIRAAVWRKELKHHVGEQGFIQPARSMSAIGG